MKPALLTVILFLFSQFQHENWDVRIPIQSDKISLTEIGAFGIMRKARPRIPAHFHTGIDIRRPGNNYHFEPIYPIAPGIVISRRDDGPFAQLIIEHNVAGNVFWSVYEHIAFIKADLHEEVYPDDPIAHFFNEELLDRYGWQFDHFHLEILKRRPIKIQSTENIPFRHFMSYTLTCFTKDELLDKFYDPLVFLNTK